GSAGIRSSVGDRNFHQAGTPPLSKRTKIPADAPATESTSAGGTTETTMMSLPSLASHANILAGTPKSPQSSHERLKPPAVVTVEKVANARRAQIAAPIDLD